MRQEQQLQSAEFDPAVKKYWLLVWFLVSFLTVLGIPLLIISIPIVLFMSQRILNAMAAILTERKLIVKRGIFFKVEKSIPLEKITDVAMSQGPLMRVFGLYRLSFETAGQSGDGALVSLIGIVDAADFREAILTQKDQVMAGHASRANDETAQSNTVPRSAGSDIEELTQSVKRIESLLATLVNERASK